MQAYFVRALFNSLRLPLKYFSVLFAILLLAGCASRPGAETLRLINVRDPSAKLVTVYVATTRTPAPSGQLGYTPGRSANMSFAKYVISIPPTHKTAEIEWPKDKPDPAKHFVTVSREILTRDSFQQAIAKEPKVNADSSERMPLVFVHGFNYNFQESLYQMAQMATDSGDRMTPVLFAWPSDASVTGYVADRDSIMFSRDPLANLLTDISAKSGSKQVVVASHSMGCYLTTEVLRQLSQTGKNEVLAKLRVALASPDIDIDVFKSEMNVIGPMNPPLTIMVAGDDRALEVSSKITGDRPRLGSVDVNSPDIKALAAAANLQFIDFSELKSGDSLNHNRFFGLPAVFKKLESQGAALNNGPFGLQGIFKIKAQTTEIQHL